jgi:hypothetical protein
VYTTQFIECRGIYNTPLNTNLHLFSHEELSFHVLYTAIFYANVFIWSEGLYTSFKGIVTFITVYVLDPYNYT